eukprot:3542460-Rhodomonas_salina.3
MSAPQCRFRDRDWRHSTHNKMQSRTLKPREPPSSSGFRWCRTIACLHSEPVPGARCQQASTASQLPATLFHLVQLNAPKLCKPLRVIEGYLEPVLGHRLTRDWRPGKHSPAVECVLQSKVRDSHRGLRGWDRVQDVAAVTGVAQAVQTASEHSELMQSPERQARDRDAVRRAICTVLQVLLEEALARASTGWFRLQLLACDSAPAVRRVVDADAARSNRRAVAQVIDPLALRADPAFQAPICRNALAGPLILTGRLQLCHGPARAPQVAAGLILAGHEAPRGACRGGRRPPKRHRLHRHARERKLHGCRGALRSDSDVVAAGVLGDPQDVGSLGTDPKL